MNSPNQPARDDLDGLVDERYRVRNPMAKISVNLGFIAAGAILAAAVTALVVNKADKPYHENLYFRGYETERAGEGRSNVRQVWQRTPLTQGKVDNPISFLQEANLATAYNDKAGSELIVGQLYHLKAAPRVDDFYTVVECSPVKPGYVHVEQPKK